MKLVSRTVTFHIMCILIFALFYFNFKDNFECNNNKKNTMIDYLLLSTTIQSGVGLSNIYPISFYGNMLMIIQQVIMIMTHVFTLYIFNL